MKQFLIILLAICIVLFVLIPLAYMSLGKIPNPWEFTPNTNYNPTYAGGSQAGAGNGNATGGAAGSQDSLKPSTNTDILSRVFGGSYSKLGSSNRNPVCADPATSLVGHVRDAKLGRVSGSDKQSMVTSDFYNLSMVLDGPVTDWQYTNGSKYGLMEDELASFTYDNLIVNILARTSADECVSIAQKNFKEFHTSSASTEYFSSPIYINLGKPIGLQSATLRTFGKSDINDHVYYWYLMDEAYAGFANRPVVTMWFSIYADGVEYWFAFRAYKAEEKGLNAKAEEILEQTSLGN